MPRTGPRTPTIEARILAALRIAARRGLGGLTVAELRARPGLCSRRSSEIAAAAERLVDRGDVLPGWRRVRFVGTRWTYRLAEQPSALPHDSQATGR
ncbi:MAG: hypothetical protein ACXWPK_10240 [Isosphaeraceae bacterium]